MPQVRGLATNVVTTVGAAVSTAAAGTALSYTVPAGRIARCLFASIANFSGAVGQQALQIIRGATTIWVQGFSAAGTAAFGGFWLQATDVIRWQTITGVAATAADFCLAVEEYEAG
jgi:hypothetical protein